MLNIRKRAFTRNLVQRFDASFTGVHFHPDYATSAGFNRNLPGIPRPAGGTTPASPDSRAIRRPYKERAVVLVERGSFSSGAVSEIIQGTLVRHDDRQSKRVKQGAGGSGREGRPGAEVRTDLMGLRAPKPRAARRGRRSGETQGLPNMAIKQNQNTQESAELQLRSVSPPASGQLRATTPGYFFVVFCMQNIHNYLCIAMLSPRNCLT
jgi:hypothetical protein